MWQKEDFKRGISQQKKSHVDLKKTPIKKNQINSRKECLLEKKEEKIKKRGPLQKRQKKPKMQKISKSIRNQ